MVENTIYSGVGKPAYECFVPYDSRERTDYRGRKLYRGEEYYVFEVANELVYVHIEDVRDYLDDDRLEVECYDLLIKLIEVYYDNYPIVM